MITQIVKLGVNVLAGISLFVALFMISQAISAKGVFGKQ